MGGCMRSMMVGLVLMMSVMSLAEADSGSVSTCGEKLVPCVDYLNSTTTPPNSCCDPLKQTVATQLQCLCDIFNTPGLLASLRINITQALQLSTRCGVKSGLSSCKAGSASPPSSSSSSIPPPATHGGDNGSGRVAFSGLSFLLLFWASMLFN